MQIPHDSVILVADGAKMLFFRNEGDADAPTLQLIRQDAQDDLADRELSTDRPGRSFSSVGPGRSAYEETDFHQQEEDRFAADTAEMLKKRAMAGEYDRLIVVAPPRTLGELRKHYHHEVKQRLAGEIAKDLTGHPVDRIEALLKEAEPSDA